MGKRFFLVQTISLLFLPSLAVLAQNNIITGNITDDYGHALSGVSIVIEETTKGTQTDFNGNFKLAIPVNATLLISFTGYQGKKITITNSSVLHIELSEDVARLDEIIVTGQSTSIKRRNLANAVSVVSSTKLTGLAPAQTFDAAVEGKIPGAFINMNSGAPGGGSSVRLRGVTSVYGNTQPLYIIDGVYADNNATSAGLNFITKASLSTASLTSNQDNPSNRVADLKPEDIDHIEILKGASSAAAYGSRATAGIVIITTKRGKDGKTKMTVSQDVGVIKVAKLLGVRRFTAATAAGLSGDSATSALLKQQFLTAQANGQVYDYEKELFGNTALERNTALTVSGGNEKTSFYISGIQKDEGGIVKNTGYTSNSFRLNLDHYITDGIKLQLSTAYINSSADRGLTGNDNTGVSLGIALSSTPDFAQLHADSKGKYPNNPFGGSNPLQTVALMKNNESVNRFIAGLHLDAILQKNDRSTTKFSGTGGMDIYNLLTTALFPVELQFQAINKGSFIQGFTKNVSSNFVLSLVNTYKFSEKLFFTTAAGVTQEDNSYNNLLDVATNIIAGQSNISQGGALTSSQFLGRFENDGFFAQEEANILDAIVCTAGVRFDRSTNNSNTNRFYAYPKASLSWNLTRLKCWNWHFVNALKLRVAYGQATNTPVYGSKFTPLVISNITGLPGTLVSTIKGDPGIGPERQTEFETGMDLSILNGRLGFEITYYSKTIRDFLMLANQRASSGYLQNWLNAGNLRNRGVEIGINAQPFANRNIQWNSSLNFWLNRSRVTRLIISPAPQGGFGYALGGSFRIEKGKSVTQIVGLNGNGAGVLGDAEPVFQMTSYNEIVFFNKLALRFLIHWKKGGDNINLTTLTNDFGKTSADYDKVSNPAGIANGIYRVNQFGKNAQPYVEDAGYLRLREIGLYYTVKKLPLQFIEAMKIGVSLNNFITLTKYKSYDPEVSNFGAGFSTGVDFDPYPATKRAAFHISFEF